MSRFRRASRWLTISAWVVGAGTFGSILTAGNALAAPFCVPVPGGQPMCIYDDANACTRRAETIRQSCVVNPKEIQLPAMGYPYCSVYSNLTVQCIFVNFNSCRQNVRAADAICASRVAGVGHQTEPDRGLNLIPQQ